MSYDNPTIISVYGLASAAFGATASQAQYIGPYGKTGKVIDIEVDTISADFVGTTTVPEVCVGLTAGSSEYARFRLGTAIGTGYTSAQAKSRRAKTVASGAKTLADFTAHVQLETLDIPADTVFMISRVIGVGGSPAGTAATRVTIRWD